MGHINRWHLKMCCRRNNGITENTSCGIKETQAIERNLKLIYIIMIEKKEIINVFVSHYHEDEENIKKFKDLLSDNYCIKNYSVTSDKYNDAHNEEYIKYEYLRPLINQSSTLICLIGPETHDSTWVDWEIREAEKLGRQIIGVYIEGAKDSDIPPALEEFADAIVGWNTNNIEKALNGESIFVNANGTSRANVTTGRVVC